MNSIEFLREKGYPYRIKGNEGYTAVLVGIQPLIAGDFMAIYRYPGGETCHSLEEIMNCFEIIEK